MQVENSPSTESPEMQVENSKPDGDETDVPIAKNWKERFSHGAEPLQNQPSITSTSYGDTETRVIVKNIGSTTLQYFSAGPENIQLFQEIFVADGWQMAGWDWCGTGKEMYEIPPSSSVELVVNFWDGDNRERMQASFSEKGTNRSGFIVLAIEPEN